MTVEPDVSPQLHLFEGYGVEIEYMIVSRDGCDVQPLSDRLLEAASGKVQSEIEMGALAWSNELVLHAIELKSTGPAPSLEPLADLFTADVVRMDQLLAPMGARLMPTAMHPLMDPTRDTRLWPHDYGEVYRAFDRIFDCRGHGWSNLQSTHLNLPFQGPDEFGRLHDAIRLVLPLLPALAASSPIVEGKLTGYCDNRLEFYRHNCARLPLVTGHVIPESIATPDEYRATILEPIQRAVGPLDPDGVLEAEWVNARGAIARLERESIEIRVVDVQEHAAADIAILAATTSILRGLCEERWASQQAQHTFPTARLEAIFLDCLRQGSKARIADADYLRLLGVDSRGIEARALWERLLDHGTAAGLLAENAQWQRALSVILARGTLAERIEGAVGESPSPEAIAAVYDQLAACLLAGRPFEGA